MGSFTELNLRWNPFGEVPKDQRGTLAVIGPCIDHVVERLSQPGFALQLMGRQGRGKSTHLHAIHTRFSWLPVSYVEPDSKLHIPHAEVVFVDESQRLTARARRRLFRRRASFVLATHQNHEEELRDAGLCVETIRVGSSDPRSLRAMVDRRIEWARLAPGPLPAVPDCLLQQLSNKHHDDLRAICDALYDHMQQRKHAQKNNHHGRH